MNIPTMQSILSTNKKLITDLHVQQAFYVEARTYYSQAGLPEVADKQHKNVVKTRNKIKKLVAVQKEIKMSIKQEALFQMLQLEYDIFEAA